jgi:phosphate uptake regulator
METRKVQLTGKSTFIISLPKTWVNDTGIKARDSIGVIPQPDGTLLLSPKMIKGKLPTKKEITVDKNEEKIHLLRKLIGAYITGYNH